MRWRQICVVAFLKDKAVAIEERGVEVNCSSTKKFEFSNQFEDKNKKLADDAGGFLPLPIN